MVLERLSLVGSSLMRWATGRASCPGRCLAQRHKPCTDVPTETVMGLNWALHAHHHVRSGRIWDPNGHADRRPAREPWVGAATSIEKSVTKDPTDSCPARWFTRDSAPREPHGCHERVRRRSVSDAQRNLREPLLVVSSKRGPKHVVDLRHVVNHASCARFTPWLSPVGCRPRCLRARTRR